MVALTGQVEGPSMIPSAAAPGGYEGESAVMRALLRIREGPRALAAYAAVVIFWLLSLIGVGLTGGCGSPTVINAVLYWIGGVLIVIGGVTLGWAVRWLGLASREAPLGRRWLWVATTVVALLALVSMAVTTFVLFFAVYGPLNCPD